jgi:hypothetical protein
MSVEANVPQRQQEASANVSSTLFSKLHARGCWTTCAYRKSNPAISMMQSAQYRTAENASGCLNGT